MRKLQFSRYLCCVLAVLLLPAVGLAEDVLSPDWRGQPSTTSQVWDFTTPDDGGVMGLAPDGPASGGMPPLPGTAVWVTPQPGHGWIDFDPASGRTGIWPLSGQIDVTVDNYNPPNEFKWVWVQLTWRSDIPGLIPVIDGLYPNADPQYPVTLVDAPVDHGDGWFTSVYEWRIYPNPYLEMFTISGNISVDQLIIDTWCIPEPATLSLLGLGVLTLLRRRR